MPGSWSDARGAGMPSPAAGEQFRGVALLPCGTVFFPELGELAAGGGLQADSRCSFKMG